MTGRSSITTGGVVALLAIVLAACGGGGSSQASGVASLSGKSSSSKATSGSGKTTSQADFRKQLLTYAACMRQNGADFPDPQFDVNGRPQFDRNGQGFHARRDDPTFQKARKACDSKRPDFAGQFQRTPAELAALRKNLLKFAQCMRSKGIDFPDPTFDANGGPQFDRNRGPGAGGGANRDDPKFQAASQTCRQTLGIQGGPGGGGFGPPGGGFGRVRGGRTASSASSGSTT